MGHAAGEQCHQGRTFLVTANEGDVREWPGMPGGTEAKRVSTLSLDPVAFPNGAALKNNASLGRLNMTAFVARLFGRQFAIVALKRIGGVMVYELTEPSAPRFVTCVNIRTFGVAANTAVAEDLGPEGSLVLPAEDSPNGRPLLVVSNEVSGTTRIFEISSSK